MELEKINNSIVSEKNQRKKEKEEKENLKSSLFNYFYKQFKKREENFETVYNELNYIKERERIIAQISKNNTFNFQFLNSIYNKTLQEIYKIFKNNYKYIEEQNKQAIEGVPFYTPHDLTFLTLELKHKLKKQGLEKLVKELGLDTSKTLTIEEINRLTEEITNQTKQIEKQQEDEKQAKKMKILYNICCIVFSPLSLLLFVLILFIWGYFKFALPILQ